MLLDRGERLEWFTSAEIWTEATASVLGFSLYIVHILTTKAHFLNKALFEDRNFVLATILYFAAGFVLLPTLALTSPMLEDLLRYPVDTTGYMTIPRGMALVAALVAMSFLPARIDNRPLVLGSLALVGYANWRMLGYSPAMDWRPVIVAGVLQGMGLGVLMPALTKVAFSTLDPKYRPEGTALFNLSRLCGSTVGIAVVQVFFYNNTQAVYLALVKNLTPYHSAAHVGASASTAPLAALSEAVTGQAALIAVIDQFEILTLVVLAVSPLVLFLRKPRLTESAK
jgi:DHA2 family multidrug resistance protein